MNYTVWSYMETDEYTRQMKHVKSNSLEQSDTFRCIGVLL